MLMWKSFSLISLNQIGEVCLHSIPKRNCWVHLLSHIRRQDHFSKNGSFLEKEFLSKEVSGRKVEFDEVIVPSLELESSSSQKTALVMPTPTREEANDDDQETSDQVTTEPRRLTRARSAPEWYDNPVLEVILLDQDEPMNYIWRSYDEPRFR